MMFRFRKKKTPKPVFDAPLRPELPFFAVGDLHGCDSLFRKLLSTLEDLAHSEARLVLVGDYVDRGDDSAEVLRRLFRMQADAGEEMMICLKGNHDQMLLDFLDDPQGTGPRWLRYGGLQTLASYGLQGVPQ
ncbi:MAG TPA: serine/threonine protein phosphatase, partial [Oceanicaulis sp.]|nr:serine/threonine protein phosphatase [Oceanicaulis sp.]